MPRTDVPGMTFSYTIRDRWLESRRIGDMERELKLRLDLDAWKEKWDKENPK